MQVRTFGGPIRLARETARSGREDPTPTRQAGCASGRVAGPLEDPAGTVSATMPGGADGPPAGYRHKRPAPLRRRAFGAAAATAAAGTS